MLLPKNQLFLHYVEEHERAWGKHDYKGRPTLSQLMKAKVVGFWVVPGNGATFRMYVTIHSSFKELERFINNKFWEHKTSLPSLKLSKVFIAQQEVKITGVKILFDKSE